MATPTPINANSARELREARLVTALMHCSDGRKLLEEARHQGIQLGSTRNPQQATPLHLSSTAVFMIQDVYALCRQVNPAAPPAQHFDRATNIASQLINSAGRYIHAEPVKPLPQTFSKPKALEPA